MSKRELEENVIEMAKGLVRAKCSAKGKPRLTNNGTVRVFPSSWTRKEAMLGEAVMELQAEECLENL